MNATPESYLDAHNSPSAALSDSQPGEIGVGELAPHAGGPATVSDTGFLEQFLAHQSKLLALLSAALRDRNVVEEVFQRVSVSLWLKRDQFDERRPFMGWATGFARQEILKLRDENRRRIVVLEPAALEAVAVVFAESVSTDEERQVALRDCLSSLPERQAQLVSDCYLGDRSIQSIAGERQQSANAVYLQLKRLRTVLQNCVSRKLSERSR